MNDWTHRCMIVSAAIVANARQLAAQVPGGTGMWTTGLSATGDEPATHYISAGMIWPQFAAMLESPQGMVDGATAIGMSIDLPTATYLLSEADISTEAWEAACTRLGRQQVRGAL